MNASKTKTMIVSRSRTMHPQSPQLTIGGTVLKESDDLFILWMSFDSKMTFEKHLRSFSIAASERLGILRKSWRVFDDRSLLGRCFRVFVLPVLENCSAVWCSAADTHLKLLDRAVSDARFLTGSVFECTLLIVDPRQSFVCFIRSGVKSDAPSQLCSTSTVCASASYTQCSGHTSVHSCTASLQNLAVQQDLYSPLCVPVEWSC